MASFLMRPGKALKPRFLSLSGHRGRCRPGPDPGGVYGPPWLYGSVDFVGAGVFVLVVSGVFTTCVSTQNAQNFVENSKMDEKHKNICDPLTQPPGRSLADENLS